MGSELTALHGVRAVHRIRRVRDEVATDRKKYLDVSIEHRVQSLNGVVPPFPGRFKVELLLKRVQKWLGGPFPHAHCAVTLDVRVPADTHRASPGAPPVTT